MTPVEARKRIRDAQRAAERYLSTTLLLTPGERQLVLTRMLNPYPVHRRPSMRGRTQRRDPFTGKTFYLIDEQTQIGDEDATHPWENGIDGPLVTRPPDLEKDDLPRLPGDPEWVPYDEWTPKSDLPAEYAGYVPAPPSESVLAEVERLRLIEQARADGRAVAPELLTRPAPDPDDPIDF